MEIAYIVRMTDRIKKQMQSNLPIINSEIDDIIKSQETSEQKIECLLDALLDYGQLGIGKSEFERLNAYYGSFSAENANAYDEFYQKIMED